MTNKCTIISQIITLLHVSTLSCHPQGAFNQYLANIHKYFKAVLEIQFTIKIFHVVQNGFLVSEVTKDRVTFKVMQRRRASDRSWATCVSVASQQTHSHQDAHNYSQQCDRIKYENGERESRTNRELEEMNKGENIVKWIKGQRISWLGHLERMEEDRMP